MAVETAQAAQAQVGKEQMLGLYRQMLEIRRCEEQLARLHQTGSSPAPAIPTSARRRSRRRSARTCARRHGDEHAPRPRPRARQGRAAARADRRTVRQGDGLLARARRQHAPLQARGRHARHERHRRAEHPDGGGRGLHLHAEEVRSGRRRLLRGRRGQQRRLPRGAEPGHRLGPAGALRLREQPVRDRSAFATVTKNAERRGEGRRATACRASSWTATMCSPSIRRRARRFAGRARAAGRPCSNARHIARARTPKGMRDAGYRTQDEVEAWRARDPIPRLRNHLLATSIATER